MIRDVKFEGTGFNPKVVTSYEREAFIKEYQLKFFMKRKLADRREMLKRVYELCKEEMKRAAEEAL